MAMHLTLPMTPLEGTPPQSTRWAWLGQWFAPPWRALLTWMVLAALGKAVPDILGEDRLITAFRWPIDKLSPSPVQLPPVAAALAVFVNFHLLRIWFEPLALRLDFARGAAWLALRTAPVVTMVLIYRFDPTPTPNAWIYGTVALLWSAALIPVLNGWRSNPWLCVLDGAMVLVLPKAFIAHPAPAWLIAALVSLSYAAMLLYGTRLLRPEERAQPMAAIVPDYSSGNTSSNFAIKGRVPRSQLIEAHRATIARWRYV
jgi:hypothetical protein